MTVKINRKLHLVVPIEQGPRTVYIHSTPIDAEVMDVFFLPISKTFAAIYGEGLGIVSGPKVAAHILKAVSQRLEMWESDDPTAVTVKSGVLGEIRRLTNVMAPGADGWQMLTLDDAQRQGVIDAEDAAEVENIITFFTVIWLMQKRSLREQVMEGAAGLWEGQLTPSNATEYRNSLATSTPAGSSGGKTG